ncbi:proline--tRNA ligase [Lentisphaerota bacterium WC36G]|nr:proline--tRNA ligase [Lentisphaerae bacterium WC36]
MRMSKMVGRRLKEDPKDAVTVSHKFLLRGGYIRPVSTGVFSMLPIAKRINDKIENIIREEMNNIDGQEVLMPVVLPAELWEESGRYKSVGPELLRFQNRNGSDMLLAMTHEEAVVHLLRSEISSYKQLPAMVYQVQTKYRDEARARGGLIRVREFTMKDAYSCHESQENLEEYYLQAHEAYVKIFDRLGMNNVLSIESDAGMMGGKVSHEFMAICDCGEDTIITNSDYTYKANSEVATANWIYNTDEEVIPLEKVHTPDAKTIEEVADFLNISQEHTAKAVFYVTDEEQLVLAVIRGDIEVNEAKLKNVILNANLNFANDEQIRAIGCEPGYASPLDIDFEKVTVVFDNSVAKSINLVAGANEADYHYKNFNFSRDVKVDTDKYIVADIATVREGDLCPITNTPLQITRGIEVGNIFQLGTKYSEAMNFNILDNNGKAKPVIMGCYGIGVGRAMASIIEQNNDNYGPIWPITVAPWEVHLCALNPKKAEVKEASESLYNQLQELDLEVLFDDRGEKPGFMFNDADLIGIPFRVVVSPKSIANNSVEFKRRGEKNGDLVPVEQIAQKVAEAIKAEYAKF